MKKFVTAMLTVLLISLMPVTAFAAETDADVWIDRDAIEISGSGVVVSVETNGKAAYGLISVAYDGAVLSVDESGVSVADGVEMYSVNVTEGDVKVSFISETEIDAGSLIKISFALADADASEETVRQAVEALEGSAHTSDEDSEKDESLAVKILGEEETSASGSGEEPLASGNQDQPGESSGESGNSGEVGSANTGDPTDVMPFLLMGMGAAACIAAGMRMKDRRDAR